MNEKTMQEAQTQTPAQQGELPAVKPIGEKQIQELLAILYKYRAGKKSVDSRVISAEQWWKVRNETEEAKEGHGKQGYRSKSAWAHNVINNKHADMMDSFPEPNILPRELGDKAEAAKLSKIVPCVMEQNNYEAVYDANAWAKNKYGTGVTKCIWDKSKLHGLGDIAISRPNILNLFWQPGIEDIQLSKYFFELDFQNEDDVKEMFPELADIALTKEVIASKFVYDDTVDTADKVPVINCYYHKHGLLHYVLFVPGHVLYASENDPEMAERGWYDHGLYPYVFDPLFPVEGSPCGYGYVDICKQPQTEIDLLKTAYVENAMVGAKPRYFSRANNGINEADYLDLNKALVNVEGDISEITLRPIDYKGLDGNYIDMLTMVIDELRETSSNTEAATGSVPSGVTSASGIAALQEASGKTSRASTIGSYRAYSQLVLMVIELIRQFYDIPRQFRIVGESGMEEFISYSNAGIKPVQQEMVGGQDMGYRQPTFDIKVQPQKRSAYTKMANNDLALQFYGLGFFNPQLADQAIACLAMMDFDSKEDVTNIIKRNGDMYQRYQMMMQIAAMLAAKCGDQNALMQIQMLAQQSGAQLPQMQTQPTATSSSSDKNSDGVAEHPYVEKARANAQQATQPDEGGMA